MNSGAQQPPENIANLGLRVGGAPAPFTSQCSGLARRQGEIFPFLAGEKALEVFGTFLPSLFGPLTFLRDDRRARILLPVLQGRFLPVTETLRCGFSGCGQSAAASLATRLFCREHFMITCYEQLDTCTESLNERPFNDRKAEAVKQFVHECVEQATNLAEKTKDLTNLERARLVDILLWAGRLGRRLRRSPRKIAVLPIRVLSDRPGHYWEEETETRQVSRHGALVECRHPAKTGDTLRVFRLDKDQQERSPGRLEIGIEFLDSDNFWELNWGTVTPAGSSHRL